MKRKLKNELAGYFEAPKPERKKAFVRQFSLQRINLLHMIAMQGRYISKAVWLFSGLFFGSTCLVVRMEALEHVSLVLAFVPFMVILSVTESVRSYRYGMEELELSARFSLKSIVLARMIMLGLGNLVVLLGSMCLLKTEYGVNIACMMAPYFLTAGGGLCIVRVWRGREGVFLCFMLALLVAVLQLYLPWRFAGVFAAEYTWIWALACGIGLLVTVREGYRTIRMTEDLIWN